MSASTETPTLAEYYSFEELDTNTTRLGRLLADAYMSMDNYSVWSQHAEEWVERTDGDVEFSLFFRHGATPAERGYMSFSFDAASVRTAEQAAKINTLAQRMREAQGVETLEIRCFRQFGMRGFINVHSDGTWELFAPSETAGRPGVRQERKSPTLTLMMVHNATR